MTEQKRGRGRPPKELTQPIEERIEYRLQSLEWMLCSNWHITDIKSVQTVMAKLRPHYLIMNENDRKYMDSAEIIIQDQIPYNEEG